MTRNMALFIAALYTSCARINTFCNIICLVTSGHRGIICIFHISEGITLFLEPLRVKIALFIRITFTLRRCPEIKKEIFKNNTKHNFNVDAIIIYLTNFFLISIIFLSIEVFLFNLENFSLILNFLSISIKFSKLGINSW